MKKHILTAILMLGMLSLAYSVSAVTQVPDFQLSLLSYEPVPVQPGQTIDLFIEVSSDESPTTDAWMEIVEEYPFTILPSQDVEHAKSLGIVSGPQKLQFQIKIAENANDGLTPLTVRYGATRDSGVFEERLFDINIQTFDAKIGLVSINQIPERIAPGEEGKLELTFRNYDDRPLKNIDVMIDFTDSYDMSSNMNNIIAVQAMINARLEDVSRRVASGLSPLNGVTPMMPSQNAVRKKTEFAAFSPIGVSTQNRLPDLGGDETYVLTIPVRALPDVQPNIYAIPVYVSYNDEDNNPFHTRVEIPAVIDVEPEVYVELLSTTLRTTDFSGQITITVANRGLTDLRYVALELQEHESVELLTAPRSVYLGNLAPGDSRNGTFTIIAHEDDITLPFKVSYRDSFNKERELPQEIPFSIINKNYYRDLPYEMWLAWLILGGVVLALTIFYVRNLKRK